MKNGALPRRLVADTEGPLVLPSWMDTPSGAPQAPPRLEGGGRCLGSSRTRAAAAIRAFHSTRRFSLRYLGASAPRTWSDLNTRPLSRTGKCATTALHALDGLRLFYKEEAKTARFTVSCPHPELQA